MFTYLNTPYFVLQKHTTGTNCEICEVGWYRPVDVKPDDPEPCFPCNCHPNGSDGNVCFPDKDTVRIYFLVNLLMYLFLCGTGGNRQSDFRWCGFCFVRRTWAFATVSKDTPEPSATSALPDTTGSRTASRAHVTNEGSRQCHRRVTTNVNAKYVSLLSTKVSLTAL